MKPFFLFTLMTFIPTLIFGQTYNCSPKDSIATNLNITIDPENVKPGQQYTITSEFDLPYEITTGSAKYVGKMDGFTVLNDNYDLCSVTTCPLIAGHNRIVSTDELPDLPAGVFELKVNWLTSQNKNILCTDFTFKS